MRQDAHDDTTELIERARRALSPREADQARVLAALSQRLYGPHNPGTASSRLVHSVLPSPTAPQGRIAAARDVIEPRGLLRGLWNRTWKGLVPLVTVAIVGLLWMTPSMKSTVQKALNTEKKSTRGDAHPQVSAAVTTSLKQLTQPAQLKELLTLEREKVTEPDSPAPPIRPEKKRTPRKRCHAADGSERLCPSPSAPTALAANPAPVQAESSLRLELDALRKAERALRERQPARALEVLEAFERLAVGGGGSAMKEERDAASTVARCALAAQGGDALYDAFVRRYPSSAYATRVRQTCLHKP